MATRICGGCRTQQTMEWSADYRFGPNAEAVRCPACGAVWGVRQRRRTPAATADRWVHARVHTAASAWAAQR